MLQPIRRGFGKPRPLQLILAVAGALARNSGPLIDGADAFGAELPAEPVDVIDEKHAGNAEPRGLDGGSDGRFVAANHEQIAVEGFARGPGTTRHAPQHDQTEVS